MQTTRGRPSPPQKLSSFINTKAMRSKIAEKDPNLDFRKKEQYMFKTRHLWFPFLLSSCRLPSQDDIPFDVVLREERGRGQTDVLGKLPRPLIGQPPLDASQWTAEPTVSAESPVNVCRLQYRGQVLTWDKEQVGIGGQADTGAQIGDYLKMVYLN